MIGFTLTLDAIKFLLAILVIGEIANRLINIFAEIILWIWFKSKGVSFYGSRNAVRAGTTFFIGTTLGEVPVVGDCLLTVETALILYMIKLEDKTGLSTQKLIQDPVQMNKIVRYGQKINNKIQKTGNPQQQKIIAQREHLAKRNADNQPKNILTPANLSKNNVENNSTQENLQAAA